MQIHAYYLSILPFFNEHTRAVQHYIPKKKKTKKGVWRNPYNTHPLTLKRQKHMRL